MPIYVYQCPSCKKTVEVIRKITDPEKAPTCEDCESHPITCPDGCSDGPEMERVITPSTFVLKGRGWAKDGYSK